MPRARGCSCSGCRQRRRPFTPRWRCCRPSAAPACSSLNTTTVYFRALSEAEIDRYIAAEQPFDCAGGFRGEGLGISLFSRVVSEDPSGLIGLPLIALARALRQLGYELP